mmetsp:Transcript_24380/g.55496  ORF Transcript_24380/g.55496 Transcript_24380/m.55496 type:complete len:423 (+) Transcript_24380:426-1694(+)
MANAAICRSNSSRVSETRGARAAALLSDRIWGCARAAGVTLLSERSRGGWTEGSVWQRERKMEDESFTDSDESFTDSSQSSKSKSHGGGLTVGKVSSLSLRSEIPAISSVVGMMADSVRSIWSSSGVPRTPPVPCDSPGHADRDSVFAMLAASSTGLELSLPSPSSTALGGGIREWCGALPLSSFVFDVNGSLCTVSPGYCCRRVSSDDVTRIRNLCPCLCDEIDGPNLSSARLTLVPLTRWPWTIGGWSKVTVGDFVEFTSCRWGCVAAGTGVPSSKTTDNSTCRGCSSAPLWSTRVSSTSNHWALLTTYVGESSEPLEPLTTPWHVCFVTSIDGVVQRTESPHTVPGSQGATRDGISKSPSFLFRVFFAFDGLLLKSSRSFFSIARTAASNFWYFSESGSYSGTSCSSSSPYSALTQVVT